MNHIKEYLQRLRLAILTLMIWIKAFISIKWGINIIVFIFFLIK